MAETVLLVEDDPSLRRLTRRLLVNLGYHVIVAEGTESAMASCRDSTNAIALLITDVFMPDVGGPELAGRLTAIRPDMKVLYVSGSSEAIINSGLLTKGSNFLQKPFSTEEFKNKVREVLDS